MSSPVAHPAPHRDRVSLWALAFALVGAPCAWAIQFTAGFALGSIACFPGGSPLEAPEWTGLRPLLWSIEAGAVAIGIAALAVAWRAWRRTQGEVLGSAHTLLEVGEGRTRFLALCGLLASGIFLIALVFNGQALLLVRTCTG